MLLRRRAIDRLLSPSTSHLYDPTNNNDDDDDNDNGDDYDDDEDRPVDFDDDDDDDDDDDNGRFAHTYNDQSEVAPRQWFMKERQRHVNVNF